jgi:F-type H+-transporting ATPase subunit c
MSNILLAPASVLASALAIAFSSLGPGIGQGNASNGALNAVSRQPDIEEKIRGMLLLSLAFMESLTIYALVVSLSILFANPFRNEIN